MLLLCSISTTLVKLGGRFVPLSRPVLDLFVYTIASPRMTVMPSSSFLIAPFLYHVLSLVP